MLRGYLLFEIFLNSELTSVNTDIIGMNLVFQQSHILLFKFECIV